MKKCYINYIFLLLTVMILIETSCKKFVKVSLPVNQLTSDFVFTDSNSAIQAITGIYSEIIRDQQQFSSGFTTLFAGMSSDELYYYTPSFRDEFINDQISLANHSNLESFFWNPCFRYIYAANKCIEGVNNSATLSVQARNLIIGEAKFIRAFCYFHLVNFFGDVPLVITTNYQQNQSLPRTSTSIVYNQIVEDLMQARGLLKGDYSSSERAIPNKFAASALLARVYLYEGNWKAAENEASAVINSGIYTLNIDLSTVFQVQSNETIWQLQPVDPSYDTWEAFEIIPTDGSSPTYLLTSSLLKAFEIDDKRKVEWVAKYIFNNDTFYYPSKYKVNIGPASTEYYVVLRLAEQLLIRAEAKARQNDIKGTQADINIIRNRAGLPNTNAITEEALLAAIEQERRVELFAEWGHRWFDLKRTKRADEVLKKLKPTTWQSTDTLYPIPESQIKLNPLLTQNPGY